MVHYLTVYDVVWVNATVLGKTVPYDYQRLEAVVAAQYSYGESDDAVRQAAGLLQAALTLKPFEAGNVRTAFICLVTFLSANGCAVQVDDKQAVDILRQAASGEVTPDAAIGALARASDARLAPGATLRTLVTHVFNSHTDALGALAEGDA